jgi:Retinoblastoma-associated protein B domain
MFDILLAVEPLARFFESRKSDKKYFDYLAPLTKLDQLIIFFHAWNEDKAFQAFSENFKLRDHSRAALLSFLPDKSDMENTFLEDAFQLQYFFRRLYMQSSKLLFDLCQSLSIDFRIRKKIWNVFVYMIEQDNYRSLFKRKHVAVILCCLVYGICKILDHDISFKEIITAFRLVSLSSVDLDELFRKIAVYPTEDPTPSTQVLNIVEYYNDVFLPAMKTVILSYLHAESENNSPEPFTTRIIERLPTNMPKHPYSTRSKTKYQKKISLEEAEGDVFDNNSHGNAKALAIPNVPWPYPSSYYSVPFGQNVKLSVYDEAVRDIKGSPSTCSNVRQSTEKTSTASTIVKYTFGDGIISRHRPTSSI